MCGEFACGVFAIFGICKLRGNVAEIVQSVHQKVVAFFKQWQWANYQLYRIPSLINHGWLKPSFNKLKCNVKAALSKTMWYVGGELCLKDESSNVNKVKILYLDYIVSIKRERLVDCFKLFIRRGS